MNYQAKFFLSIMLWTLLPNPAQAVQVVLTPVMDATLYEDAEGNLANGGGEHLFFGRVGGAGSEELRRALLKFDVSSIPAEARIDSVTVAFEIDKSPGVGALGGLAKLHRLTASWNEGPTIAPGNEGTGGASAVNDVTWIHRSYPSSGWTDVGGDFVPTPSGSAGYGTGLEFLDFGSTVGLRADVAAWVNSPGSNHGWILLGREDEALTARRVYARESVGQNVPKLTVDYSIISPTDNLNLTQIATSLTRPVAIANAHDGSGRVFVVEQAGLIRIFDTNSQTILATPYLDISDLVDDSDNEQGLLGLAFHPDFSTNRKFFIYYTRDPGPGLDRSTLAVYQQNPVNPNIADAESASVLMEFEQNAGNHNGGDLHFGADGYLYIATGDGGGSGDTYNNAQNKSTLKGKILRIDVDAMPQPGAELCGINPQYGIPAGNAFPGTGNGCDEILHLGLRNPWKFSFDAQTEEMYIGDVGQGEWEEVDYAAVGAAGLNFGWPCREGAHSYPGTGPCPNAVEPIFEYSSGSGSGNCSITGGYVYRGAHTALSGYYVYADYCSHRVWLARKNSNGVWESIEWAAAAGPIEYPTAFGQDEKCELYVVDRGTIGGNANAGKLYRIDDSEIVQRSGFEALRCQ